MVFKIRSSANRRFISSTPSIVTVLIKARTRPRVVPDNGAEPQRLQLACCSRREAAILESGKPNPKDDSFDAGSSNFLRVIDPLLEVEPAGGFERPVCRLQFGRSDIELHRHMKLLIPQSPPAHSGRNDRMRQIADKAAMELCLHAQPSPQRKGHEISGNKYLLKPIADLEFP